MLMRRILSCLASVGLVSRKVYFSETFGEEWEERWTVSDWKKSEGTQGSWFVSAGKWFADEKEDVGLQIAEDPNLSQQLRQFLWRPRHWRQPQCTLHKCPWLSTSRQHQDLHTRWRQTQFLRS